MKKYRKTIVIGFLIALFLIIGVPLIINACYLSETVIFSTVWDGADVLTYYGTILGSFVAIGTLAGTILFTQKQIRSDRNREKKYKDWNEKEDILNKILENIHPLYCSSLASIAAHSNDIQEGVLQMYTVIRRAEIMFDKYMCVTSAEDKRQLQSLNSDIEQFLIQIKSLADKYANNLMELHDIDEKARGKIQRYNSASMTERNNAGSKLPTTPKEMFKEERKKLRTGRKEINSEADTLHKDFYKKLLKKKEQIFSDIYQEIEATTEKTLHFWNK